MKHRTLMIVLALTSALLLAGSAAAAKKPGKGKKAGGEATKVKRFLSSPEVAKAFRLPKSVRLSPRQAKKRNELIVSLGRDIREAARTAKSAITAEGKKFQLDRVKQMQREGRQKMLAILTPQQRSQAAKGGSAKQGEKKRGKKKAGRKKKRKK